MNLAKKWAEAYAPYARALEKLKLPPRRRKGSKSNFRRTKIVVEAMRAVKERLRAKEKR